MVRLSILVALAAMCWAVPGATFAVGPGIYGTDGTWRVGRHIISPRIARVDPRSFRLHARPEPSPAGPPAPLTSPSHGSIGSRPYGIGYFFLDASQRRQGPAEDLE
jgi:hypothetical protein